MEQPGLQVDLVPAQGDGLGDAQAMAVHQGQERLIPAGVASCGAGSGDQALDLGRGEVLPGPGRPTRPAAGTIAA